MPILERIQKSTGGLWMTWYVAAVALTFALCGWLIYRTLARGDLPVDAALGAQLTARAAMLLAVAWIPVIVGAAVRQRFSKRD